MPDGTDPLLGFSSLARRSVSFESRVVTTSTLEVVATEREYESKPDAEEKLARYIARGTEAIAMVRALLEQLEAKDILTAGDANRVRERADEIDRELRDTP